MIVIAVLNSKGGVGKTTLTACLAVRASKDAKVCVCDLDPQPSYSNWYKRRGSPDNPALLTGEDRASEAVEKLELVSPYEFVFMDGPPGSLVTTEDAIQSAHFIVVPVRSSGVDLEASQDCISLCKSHKKPYLVVLNSVAPRENALDENARGTLSAFKIPVAKQGVAQRVSYVNAMTTGKTGPEKDAKAADEIDTLWREIKKLALAAAKAKGGAK